MCAYGKFYEHAYNIGCVVKNIFYFASGSDNIEGKLKFFLSVPLRFPYTQVAFHIRMLMMMIMIIINMLKGIFCNERKWEITRVSVDE